MTAGRWIWFALIWLLLWLDLIGPWGVGLMLLIMLFMPTKKNELDELARRESER